MNLIRYYLALVGKNYNIDIIIIAALLHSYSVGWVFSQVLSITNKTAPEGLKAVEKQLQTGWSCSTKLSHIQWIELIKNKWQTAGSFSTLSHTNTARILMRSKTRV